MQIILHVLWTRRTLIRVGNTKLSTDMECGEAILYHKHQLYTIFHTQYFSSNTVTPFSLLIFIHCSYRLSSIFHSKILTLLNTNFLIITKSIQSTKSIQTSWFSLIFTSLTHSLSIFFPNSPLSLQFPSYTFPIVPVQRAHAKHM